ncbi:hypothetical protein ACMHYB_47625 [Sorangium sp. So ce1128]
MSLDMHDQTSASQSAADAEVMDPIVDKDEMMYRQIGRDAYKYGRLTSLAFLPKKNDNRLLSTDRGSMSTPESAFITFAGQGFLSRGTWGVTVGECENIGMRCIWNPNPIGVNGIRIRNEAHSLIDFRSITPDKQVKVKAVLLSTVAGARGCMYVNHNFPAEPDAGG